METPRSTGPTEEVRLCGPDGKRELSTRHRRLPALLRARGGDHRGALPGRGEASPPTTCAQRAAGRAVSTSSMRTPTRASAPSRAPRCPSGRTPVSVATASSRPSTTGRSSSVQYMMALGREDAGTAGPAALPLRLHRGERQPLRPPGTGYKEFWRRTEFTEQRFGYFTRDAHRPPGARGGARGAESRALRAVRWRSRRPLGAFETERQASFFLNGGLAAVHAEGRDRQSIWDAMQRREVYGTSGPRILLWFDLLNAPGGRPAFPWVARWSLGDRAPIFQVRGRGLLRAEAPGCPDRRRAAPSSAERIARVCQGECYNPTDERRGPSARIEVDANPQRSSRLRMRT